MDDDAAQDLLESVPDTEITPTPKQTHELKMRTSMTLVLVGSRFAKNQLKSHVEQTEPAPADGLHKWRLEPGCTPEAMEIVMNMIHGRSKDLPESVTLDTLADVAVAVERLQCEEAVRFIAKSWIQKLDNADGHEMAKWIMVAIAFDETEIFRKKTQMAIMFDPGPLDTLDLPIPQAIVDKIEREKKRQLNLIRGAVEDLDKRFVENIDPECNIFCRAAHHRALTEGMKTMKLFTAPRGAPESYPSTSIFYAVDEILHMSSSFAFTPKPVGPRVSPTLKLFSEQLVALFPVELIMSALGLGPDVDESERVELVDIAKPAAAKLHDCNIADKLMPAFEEIVRHMYGLNLSHFVQK